MVIYQDAKRRGIYLALFTDQIQIQINWINRGFNKHRLPTKYVSNFDQRSWLLFSPKEEATHAYDVVNK